MHDDDDTPPMGPPPRGDRLIALFLFGIVALNPPLLEVFGFGHTIFGWPLLAVYIFTVWCLLILFLAIYVEGYLARRTKTSRGDVDKRSRRGGWDASGRR